MEKLVDGKLIEEKLVEGILDLARLVFNEAYTEDNAKPHEETIDDFVKRPLAKTRDGLREQGRVVLFLDGLEDQGGIGGGVLWTKLRELMKVARVGDHGGELLERLE